jgi:hypothetical protein
MTRRHRGTRTLRELRQEVEAAEARGLIPTEPEKPKRERAPRLDAPARERSQSSGRMKVVWEVCDVGGRAIATYEYPLKADAEAHAARLIERGKGHHFVRSAKQPMG